MAKMSPSINTSNFSSEILKIPDFRGTMEFRNYFLFLRQVTHFVHNIQFTLGIYTAMVVWLLRFPVSRKNIKTTHSGLKLEK